MADGRHIAQYWKRYNTLINGPIWMKLRWSHHVPDMSAMLRLPWQRPLPSNGALYIQQLWASGGRTREPILMKFGTQQQIGTAMAVTWSNIKIFKIQNGGRRHVGKYSKSHNSPNNGLTGTQVGWSHPTMSPTCPHDAVAMATAIA